MNTHNNKKKNRNMDTNITLVELANNPASCLQEVDGHHIIAIEHGGMIYAGLACIIAPRSDASLGMQAFVEMDDAEEIPYL